MSGTGVQVLSTTVSSPTTAVARLRIAPGAPLDFRDLTVATGAESAALLDGFEVTPAPPLTPPGGGGGGGGGPGPCSDRSPPRATLLAGRHGARAARRRLQLRGRASDYGCGARVARVEVAISRAASRHRCRFVDRGGRLTRAGRCGRAVWLKATGTVSWRLTTKRRLPRGRYTIRVRARDAAGNVQPDPASRTVRN